MPPSQQTEPRTPVMDRLLSLMGHASKQVMQYGKDVVTGKKLIEGLKQNDGVIDGLISHGANELGTVLLTGQPAPVYTRSMSPQDQDQQLEIDEAVAPERNDIQAGEIVSHAEARQATHHEVTVNQNAGEDMQHTFFQSSLSNVMDRVRSLSPTKQPEMEMSK